MPTTATIDLKRKLARLYRPGDTPALVEVPELSFLMVDGTGDPGTSPTYADALQAMYSVAYTLKFALKRGPLALDVTVMPLEGLWWVPDMSLFTADRDEWRWTLMIAQADEVTADMVREAKVAAAAKKQLDAIAWVRLERYAEGLAAQVMHHGPYSEEGPTIQRLHGFIAEQGFLRCGKHHEIYLGDPRRTGPDKLRTIIRQPVAPARVSR